MGIKLEQCDPKLRARILRTLNDADQLKQAIVKECPTPRKKRIRQDSKPLMNKLEEEYYYHFLYDKRDGREELLSPQLVIIQSMRFRLANGVWYKPDFFLPESLPSSKPVGIEVKGEHAFRGGFENLKMAATKYPWIKWILVWKENGVWQEQTVLP